LLTKFVAAGATRPKMVIEKIAEFLERGPR